MTETFYGQPVGPIAAAPDLSALTLTLKSGVFAIAGSNGKTTIVTGKYATLTNAVSEYEKLVPRVKP